MVYSKLMSTCLTCLGIFPERPPALLAKSLALLHQAIQKALLGNHLLLVQIASPKRTS